MIMNNLRLIHGIYKIRESKYFNKLRMCLRYFTRVCPRDTLTSPLT